MPPRPLTHAGLLAATHELAGRDRGLRRILRLHGPPPLWARRPGFATLVRIILEQQVSLASARATFNRLENRIDGLTADRVRTLGPTKLRALGLTRQKARYLIELADAVSDGWLDLRGLGRLDEAQARTALMAVSGIGPWTADVYLLEVLRRPDVADHRPGAGQGGADSDTLTHAPVTRRTGSHRGNLASTALGRGADATALLSFWFRRRAGTVTRSAPCRGRQEDPADAAAVSTCRPGGPD